MNKLLQSALVMALLLGAGAAQAQLSAGHIMLTGSAGYSSDKNGVGDRTATFTAGTISPQVGYFIVENLAIGLGISYDGITEKTKRKSLAGTGTVSYERTTTTMSYGPFVRYYKPVGERAAFFGQLGAGFGSSKVSQKNEGTDYPQQPAPTAIKDQKYSLLGASLTPGFTFFPTDHFGLEISMGGLSYSREKLKDKPEGTDVPDTWEDDNTITSLEASFGLRNLLIGATWYLGGK